MPRRSVFFDTSCVLALENKDDPHHDRAKLLDGELIAENALLVLHWGILLEVADGYGRMRRRQRGMQLLATLTSEEGFEVHPLTAPLFDEALHLYSARTDKEWGLTDCVSFVLMKREGITDALTADVHFVQAGFRALLLDA